MKRNLRRIIPRIALADIALRLLGMNLVELGVVLRFRFAEYGPAFQPGAFGSAGDILRLTEGDLAPVACLEKGAEPCARVCECKTLPMWSEFYKVVNDYFDGKTLADILE